MPPDNQLADLIGQIYDAALKPDLWPKVLAPLSAFVGGSAASLFTKNVESKTGTSVYDVGIDPAFRQLYFDYYVKLDPLGVGQILAPIEEPVATADLISYDEFLQTRFYKEWARPQKLVDFVGAVLDRSSTTAAMFGVFRHERDGVVDAGVRERMRLVVPHVRRAVLIGRLIDLKTVQAATMSEVLDGISAGMFLLGQAGAIVHASASGRALLDRGHVVTSNCGRLAAADGQADQVLRDALLAAAQGDLALGVKGIAVPLIGRDDAHYVAHVLPLNTGERRGAGRAYAAAVAVFVRKATLDVTSPAEVIAKTYRLTPTELRVLMAIVEIGGVPEVAIALGVAETTVKTHLRRLFEKTGTSRQVELVKLAASYSNPLVG
jgi:DNA-binding CsgD family transcriptional regulator